MLLEMSIVLALLGDTTNPVAAAGQHCYIENAIYEGSAEGSRGMRLVTEVTVNRLDVGHRGARTACEVIYSPAQFGWTFTPEDQLRTYTEAEYLKAAQAVFSVLYDEVPRLLPTNVLHYQNPTTATDDSWYDADKVVLAYKGHHFLRL